jgi:hypothetical protein
MLTRHVPHRTRHVLAYNTHDKHVYQYSTRPIHQIQIIVYFIERFSHNYIFSSEGNWPKRKIPLKGEMT